MKKLILLIVLCLASCLWAADIRWDCFTQSEHSYYDEQVYVFEYLGFDDLGVPSSIMPGIGVSGTKKGSQVTLDCQPMFLLAFQGVWVEKSYGDVIDYSTMSGRDDYLAVSDIYYTPGDVFTPINTKVGETVYLAVMQSGYNKDSPDGKYFGWLELLVGTSGNDVTLTLTRSAMAVDGSPLFAGGGAVGGGAIPEPSGAVLVLVGVGLLGLRRRTP